MLFTSDDCTTMVTSITSRGSKLLIHGELEPEIRILRARSGSRFSLYLSLALRIVVVPAEAHDRQSDRDCRLIGALQSTTNHGYRVFSFPTSYFPILLCFPSCPSRSIHKPRSLERRIAHLPLFTAKKYCQRIK